MEEKVIKVGHAGKAFQAGEDKIKTAEDILDKNLYDTITILDKKYSIEKMTNLKYIEINDTFTTIADGKMILDTIGIAKAVADMVVLPKLKLNKLVGVENGLELEPFTEAEAKEEGKEHFKIKLKNFTLDDILKIAKESKSYSEKGVKINTVATVKEILEFAEEPIAIDTLGVSVIYGLYYDFINKVDMSPVMDLYNYFRNVKLS